MYAPILNRTVSKQNPNPFTFGETMKKILLALLFLVFGSVGLQAAATNTPTSTLTPTPTKTNTPTSGFTQGTGHVIVQAGKFLLDDGVSVPATTPVPGSADVWKAQFLSYTAAVFSTNTASARIQLTVPADYMRNPRLWLYAVNSTLTNTVTVQADISRVKFGSLTSTSAVWVGPSTNVHTQFTGPLVNARYSRVFIPLSNTVGAAGTLIPGSLLNIKVIRTGASGNLNVMAAEFEYDVNYPMRP